jgi:hypothetical protein
MGIREIISRAASLLVVSAYLAIAAFGHVPKKFTVPDILLATVPALLLIWFPEQIGNAIISTLDRPAPTETPPVLVAFMGWVFLVGVPVVIALLLK